jgi:hypothetical protein
MATYLVPLGINAANLRVYVNEATVNTVNRDVFGGAATLYTVRLDCTATAATTYLKFWNSQGSSVVGSTNVITVGTTAPDMILPARAGIDYVYTFSTGLVFSTGVSFCAVTAAGTAGTTSPGAAVIVHLTAQKT